MFANNGNESDATIILVENRIMSRKALANISPTRQKLSPLLGFPL